MTRPAARFGSDVMADVLAGLDLPYVALNPGSSFRGLHDSLVNRLDNSIQMVTCPHEKVAVGVAHGYAKATGRPMAAILHNVVGLLHGAMGIYYAHLDRVPILVLGGSGPAAYDRRRPNIDWIHSANVQGNAVRDYTKWDAQPASLASVTEALVRAHRIAAHEPAGPAYVALDAGMQEEAVAAALPAPELSRFPIPSPVGADPAALHYLAQRLVEARRPVIIPGYAGRSGAAFTLVPQLAELAGAAVVDTHIRLSMPTSHPLSVDDPEALRDADCVLFLDVKDMGKPIQRLESTTRTVVSRIPATCTVLSLGFHDLELSSWSEDYAALVPCELRVTADTAVALPLLVDSCRALVADEAVDRKEGRDQRRKAVTNLRRRVRDRWAREAEAQWDASPVSTARLAAEVWSVVRDHDWVLTAGTAEEWALRTWDFDAPHRHPGRQLGTATQIGISLGVALAHKDSDRLVVDLQPDGDLMFDVGALWVASYHRLPLLVVTVNNRAYFNDWEHQERLASQRGTDVERTYIGMEIDRPAPDFAALARGFGWYAEGPVHRPEDVAPAVRRAAEHVISRRLPALVDVVCQRRAFAR